MIKLNQFSDEEFIQIVKDSTSYKEIADKIGYATLAGEAYENIKARINNLKISTAHISRKGANPQNRTEENIFIKDSTATQTTLRNWYKKGEYTPYICSICGMEPIWQNKPLTLILDHINGENHDDRLENLRWVCPNCNQQLPTTGRRKKKEIKQQNFCIDCGEPISEGAVRCRKCNGKYTASLVSKPIPLTREELKDLVRKNSFTEVGKQLVCSRKQIITWCKKLNLPSLKKEIDSYSDEEWENI